MTSEAVPTEGTHYTGGCHCRSFTYEIVTKEPLTEIEISECNCSICTLNGYLMAYFSKEQFKYGNKESLKGYRFNSKELEHNFCSNCGTSVFVNCDRGKWTGTLALNVRTIDGLDIKGLKFKYHDGRSLGA